MRFFFFLFGQRKKMFLKNPYTCEDVAEVSYKLETVAKRS